MEMVITATELRVYDDQGQDFASAPLVEVHAYLVWAVILSIQYGNRAFIEELLRRDV